MINFFENINYRFSLFKKKIQFYKTNIYCIQEHENINFRK